MTSESQERMLAIVTPENWPAVAALCAKWEVRANIVGHVVEPEVDELGNSVGFLRVRRGFGGEILAEVPCGARTTSTTSIATIRLTTRRSDRRTTIWSDS